MLSYALIFQRAVLGLVHPRLRGLEQSLSYGEILTKPLPDERYKKLKPFSTKAKPGTQSKHRKRQSTAAEIRQKKADLKMMEHAVNCEK